MKLETVPQDVILGDDFEQRDVAIGDIAFILDMFADKVYSHKERAVIRELSCNAHDSHFLAGTMDVPFDVHLPTVIEPWFSLRDYGTGLEDDDIANVYGAIGVSTKRDSNALIGCYGIGSLSPYSLCDSFTIKSYLNGIVRTYQCMRDEQRKPKVIPLGVEPTDEANGLEVKLTVNGKVSVFEKEAEQVFLFWEGTFPNINSQQVQRNCEHMRSKYIFKGDDFGLTSSWGDMYALMGNIAYEIPSELDEFDVDGYLKFDLGELDFDTARENLSMTDKTKAVVRAKFKSVKDKLKDIAIEQIEEKDTPFAKAALAETLSSGQLGRFVGTKKLECYSLPEPKEQVTYWQSKYRGSEKYSTKHINARGVGTSVEFYIDKPRMQTRIKLYLKDMGSGHTIYIFKDLAQALECKIPTELLEDLDGLPKMSHVSNSGSGYSKCKTLSFSSTERSAVWGMTNDQYWKEINIELDGSEIVYVEVNRWQPVGGDGFTSTNSQINSTLKTSSKHIGEISLVGLKTAFLKTAAFRKGNFIHLDDYLKREYIKKAPKTFFKYKSGDLATFETINKVIDNADVREIVELAQSCENSEIAGICKCLGITVEIKEDAILQEIMDEWNERHKMLTFVTEWEINQNAKVIAEYIGGHLRKG